MSIHDRFEKYANEHCKFELVENKKSQCADIHAFILINEIFKPKHDIIVATDYYGYFLNLDEDDLSILTDEQIIELLRCGFSYDTNGGSLYKFV